MSTKVRLPISNKGIHFADGLIEGRPVSAKETPPLKTRAAVKQGERNVRAKKGKKRSEGASLNVYCSCQADPICYFCQLL